MRFLKLSKHEIGRVRQGLLLCEEKKMDFDTKLDRYAELLISHGLNVQPGQLVNLAGEVIHRDLLNRLMRAAYRRGAKYVNVDLIDPWHLRQRILESKSEDFLTFVPHFVPARFEEILDSHGAALRLVGSEEPDCLSDLPPDKMNALQLSVRQHLKRYYQEGVGKSKIHWTVAAAATPKWGKKVFPELSEDDACKALWEELFRICRVDKHNYLELWSKHDDVLQTRAKFLTKLKIKKLHFTGPGTDLSVYLSKKAVFKGGGDQGPYGVHFEANVPTEECFTTPDCRKTEGKARVTRPFLVNGTLIKGLEIVFKDGNIVDFKAEEGEATFAAYIQSDAEAKRLGEVALVGIDSPIYQSGRIFEEILLDENAACHIAVGFAYKFCIEGGDQMLADELDEIGCNNSHVHTDMMISSEHVDVHAETYDGKVIPIILKGKWAQENYKSCTKMDEVDLMD